MLILKQYRFHRLIKHSFCFLMFWVILAVPDLSFARVIDDVKVKLIEDGYEITLVFSLSMQYLGHTPQEELTKELYVQLKPINFNNLTADEETALLERISLSWNQETGIPLQEMTFEGGDTQQQQMSFLFTEEVECDVHTGLDLRSLIVKIKTKKPPIVVPEAGKAVEAVPEIAVKVPAEPSPLPEDVASEDAALAQLMTEAKGHLTTKNYDRAVQLYTKILETAQGPVKQQAQEFLGIARERNGQLAHAKAEYEKYLQDYPQGQDAERVRQRLAGLVTAAKEPKEPLKAPAKIVRAIKPKWLNQYYGNVSQFFYRDQTTPKGSDLQINRYDLSTDLDLSARLKSDKFDINARFTGSTQDSYLKDGDDEDRISAVSFDTRYKQIGLYGRIGRQTLTSGGVLGRFDGIHMKKDVNSKVKFNTVLGYTVEDTSLLAIEPDKRFYGMSFDWGTFAEHWNFNTFFINQTNSGALDRRAIGGEARYFDPKKSFFTLADYDLYFNQLNILLFNSHYDFPTKTTLNFVVDYRKSPILTTNNAIQGQGVTELSDLFNRFSKKELKQLAEDRTTNSKTVTVGIAQELKQDLQLTTDFTISEIEGTVASGGGEGSFATGHEYFFSPQLIASNVFMENDVLITGFTYANSQQYNTYTLNINDRFPITRKFRAIPKFRFDYRVAKTGHDTRVSYKPTFRADYSVTKSMRFEAEVGAEWIHQETTSTSQKSMESFVTLGYRINF